MLVPLGWHLSHSTLCCAAVALSEGSGKQSTEHVLSVSYVFRKYMNVHTCRGIHHNGMQGWLLPKTRQSPLRLGLPLEESVEQSVLETISLVHLARCLQCCSGNERNVPRKAGSKVTAQSAPESAGLVECRVPGCLDFCLSSSQKIRLADPTDSGLQRCAIMGVFPEQQRQSEPNRGTNTWEEF